MGHKLQRLVVALSCGAIQEFFEHRGVLDVFPSKKIGNDMSTHILHPVRDLHCISIA